MLDKRRLYELNRSAKPKAFDLVLEQQRKSCQHMTRVRKLPPCAHIGPMLK